MLGKHRLFVCQCLVNTCYLKDSNGKGHSVKRERAGLECCEPQAVPQKASTDLETLPSAGTGSTGQVKYWLGQKVCPGFFHDILQKNPSKPLGQPNIFLIYFNWRIIAYNGVLVSDIQPQESAITIHLSPPS